MPNVLHVLSSHELSIAVCFGLGVLHALEPGHGKTALAAHLLGEKSLLRPAVAALATALSHSISILLVATLVHGALDLSHVQETGSTLSRTLNLAVGLLLSVVGIGLYVAHRRQRVSDGSRAIHCGCAHHRREDPAAPNHSCSAMRKSLNALLLGFAVGLVPCPTALVALSQAIVGHDWITATEVTFTFSAGIFLGLFVVGAVLGVKIAPRLLQSGFARASARRYALVQATVVFATGVWHVYRGL